MRHCDYFNRLHPLMPTLYYGVVFCVTMFCMHPVVIAISLFSSMLYGIWLSGSKLIKNLFWGYIPLAILGVFFNIAFNHRGETILCYLNENPLTLESIIYGIVLAFIFITAVLWLSCFHQIMTADKLMCVTGKMIPVVSLMISMSLRFVPRYKVQLKNIIYSQKAIGRDISKGNLLHRLIVTISCVSILIHWALENSLETVASMKGRGFCIKGRTSFTPFQFTKRDRNVGIVLSLLGLVIIILAKEMKVCYSPYIEVRTIHLQQAIFFIAYACFCNIPMFFNFTRERNRC